MPTYVYGCNTDKGHPQKEVVHRMSEDPTVICDVCSSPMHRIPQPLGGLYLKPEQVLTAWMDENYVRTRTGRPRFSPDLVKYPGRGLPGTEFHTRKRKVTT